MSRLSPLPTARVIPLLPVVLLLAALFYRPAAAQDELKVSVVIREIVAENSGQGVDSRLGDIGKDLKKMSYTTFRLAQTHNQSIQGAQQGQVSLQGNNSLVVSSEGEEDGKLRLKVKLTPGDKKQRSFESMLRFPDGGTIIIAGPAFGEGVLILALTASR